MSVNVDLLFLSRTVRLRYGNSIGAAVCINIENINFLITAAHVVSGLADGESIALRHNGGWQLFQVASYLGCDFGTDIGVIRLQQDFGEGLPKDKLDASMTLGQEVIYCGFPLGLEMEGLPGSNNWPTPLIKSAIFSGVIPKAGCDEFLFDTINNRGFSGGPIVKRDPGGLKLVGIVSGYKFDAPIPVLKKGEAGTFVEMPDYFVQPNSGFMVGVSIQRALDLIGAAIG